MGTSAGREETLAAQNRMRAGLGKRPSVAAWLMSLLLFLAALPAARAQSNGVLREIFTQIGGSSLLRLTNYSNFPNAPDVTEILTNAFEGGYNYDDQFGDRFRALLVPPVTGTYVIWVQGDDAGALYLSSDASPANAVQIARNDQTALYQAWYTFVEQESAPIQLEAGRRYYIEAIHSAGTGDDSFSVGWKLPNGTLEQPIPITRLYPYGQPAVSPPAITGQPAALSLAENSPAVFRVAVSNLDAVVYQWQRNFVPIPGAIGASYTLNATTNDHGANFRCVVSNALGSATSSSATLSVTPDTVRPTLFSVANLTSNLVQVMFSEPVDPPTATNAINYAINNGVTVLAAAFGPSSRIIHLTTTPLARGGGYTLTVNNVRDRAAARNSILAASQLPFTALLKGIYREIYPDIPGMRVLDLTNSPAFPNQPSQAELLTEVLETPSYPSNHYGQRLRARLLPPVTGNYTFWVAANDTAQLYLGTNDQAASARLVASVSHNVPVSARQWEVEASQRSLPIALVGGQQYYLEVLMKGSVSDQFPPDHLAVRWQMPDASFEEPISASRLIPVGLGLPQIGSQPTNFTAIEGGTATFRVAATNLDADTFQWQENGANIPGATNSSYTVPLVQLSQNGAAFRCVVANPVGSTNSAAALLFVTADVTRPTITGAYNISSNRVVVAFSEPVEIATGGSAANYSIPGLTLSSPVVAADGRSVMLNSTAMTFGNTYTITVNNVRDRAVTPNVILPGSSRSFMVADFYLQDVGGPPPGSVVFTNGGVNLSAGNGDFSNTNDAFSYSYQQRRGDFDVKVRIARLEFGDSWTMAGLMAREDLGTNSRYAGAFATPSVLGSFFQTRTNAGTMPLLTGSFPVNYPYTWLRLQRTGGTLFNGYASYDGQTWTRLGSVSLNLPSTIYLGYAMSSRKEGRTVTAEFRDFQDVSGGTIGVLAPDVEPPGPSTRRTPLTISEIMYHPAERTDGRRMEFVEIYNSNPYYEDISGFRLSGDIAYTFPPNTILPGGGFVVVARSPEDLLAINGVQAMGPYESSLPNDRGTVRLRNQWDAILVEVNYESRLPWPAAPDGTGHSLVLARPSLGERSPRAWAQSDRIGGSPGSVDGIGFEPWRNVVINEFLAGTVLPDLDFVELYNHSIVPVDISGCWLTDDPATNKFRIPDGTVLGPSAFISFNEATLGFGLSSSGEALYLISSNRTRVIDSLKFEGQELNVSFGRSPDGAPGFQALASSTPGQTNAGPRVHAVVINEIMYNPVSGLDDDEFIELHNRGGTAVLLNNWKFIDGIEFAFPSNTVILAGGYLVVAKNVQRMLTNYPGLSSVNTVGPFIGTLANGGERIVLTQPGYYLSTNGLGQVRTNQFDIVVDDVHYGTGGQWGEWSDGGGSSLELIDPRSDNRLAPNWGDSDDTAESQWTLLSVSGLLDNGVFEVGDWDALQIYLPDSGECLVDAVDVRIPTGSANLVTNSTFESSLNFWVPQGNHRYTTRVNQGYNSSWSMKVVSRGGGDNVADRIYTILNTLYTNDVTGSISARVKWLRGRPEIILRLRGNLLELAGTMQIPTTLGTPGARNSRYATNAGPAIVDVFHNPVVPAANQPVVVSARIHDSDGIQSVNLTYRVDPFGSPVTVAMNDTGTGGDAVPGDGVYSATIPGQSGLPNSDLVAFYITATDRFSPAASRRFPANAPTNECLVRFGEATPLSSYGTYRFWMTQNTLNSWIAQYRNANEAFPGTFVYGNFRPIYGAGSHYAGSPAHNKLYDTPVGTNCDYQFRVPADDTLLNAVSLRVQQPGLFGSDFTGQNEQNAYWMINQMGLPFLNRRSVNVYVNGFKRGRIYEDTQRPNGDFDEQWYPNGSPGDLYKIGFWQEFSDDTEHRDTVDPSLQVFTTTGGVKKLARYRQTFAKRSSQGSIHDYSNLYNLVDTLNTSATGDAYIQQVMSVVDVRSWARAFAAERIINNTDLYGAKRYDGPFTKPGAQNSFLLKPQNEGWKFLIWDVDAAYLGKPTDPLFDFTDPPVSNMFLHPLVLRIYWQALEEAVNGPLRPDKLHPLMDDRYAAYLAGGISATAPTKMKEFLGIRRDYIIQLLSEVQAPMAINNNGGNNFTSPSTLVSLCGTAPIGAHVITINDIEYPLSWSSISNWCVQLPLNSATNQFVVRGYDAHGNLISTATDAITVYFSGPVSRPEDSLVISEIMFQPARSNAHYVEIFNRSTNTTFSLYNYRINGLDFTFGPGDFIAPRSYIVVPSDRAAFVAAYGSGLPLAGEDFKGGLDRNGETLSLIQEALSTNQTDVLVDKVKYEVRPPWPALPAQTNRGVALQLIDPSQDNARVSNWDDGTGWRYYTFTGIPNNTTAKLYVYLDAPGEVYLDDITIVNGFVAGVGGNVVRNGGFEQGFSPNWSFQGTSPGANKSHVTNTVARSGTNSLRLIFEAAGSTSKCLFQDALVTTAGSSNWTVSFWFKAVPGSTYGSGSNLTVRFGSSTSPFVSTFNVGALTATPGVANAVSGSVNPYPLLWINEVQPNNQNGLRDNTGTTQPWIELYNNGPTPVSLDGLYLSKSYSDLTQWPFPAGMSVLPGQFKVVFMDGRPQFSTGSELHTSNRLDAASGAVILSRGQQILDYINYTNVTANVSVGSYPDGQLFTRQLFYFVTPGTTNNGAPVPVAINEWMASNTGTMVDPATGTFEDWIELYNFGDAAVSLDGFYMTDDLGIPKKWRIPNGTVIEPHGFLLVWADNDPFGTNTLGNALHSTFRLSRTSDEIGLFSPEGIAVDSVIFGFQSSDVSQGRFPDGNTAGSQYYMPNFTPRTNNIITNNINAPVLAGIPNVMVNEGGLIIFTNSATDIDYPAQSLAYSFLGTVPEGADVHPSTGVFTWTPGETQGGQVHSITIQVSDNGGPPLTDSKTFQVNVIEINSPPTLAAIADQTVNPGSQLVVAAVAGDGDVPQQSVTFSLVSAPSGAIIDGAGVLTWTPTQGQASTTNVMGIMVTDSGSPAASVTRMFTVVVGPGSTCNGMKGDVAPRVGGNDLISVTDWVQVGRFVAGLSEISNTCEFAKADCAPKPCGNGALSITDWVQAGRYVAGLDTNVLVQNCPPVGGFAPAAGGFLPASESRVLFLPNLIVENGQTNCLQVLLCGQGDENSAGFSIQFDTNLFTYISARRGPLVAANAFFVNTNQARLGRLGLIAGVPSGDAFPPGTNLVAEVCLRAISTNRPVSSALRFGNQPVIREVSDPDANALGASWQDGAAVVAHGNSLLFETVNIQGGTQVRLRLVGAPSGVWMLQGSADLQAWQNITTVTNDTGLLEYIDLVTTNSNLRFYRAVQPQP